MQEMIPFVGPHTDIMGPDMGTNEQIMAWFMDTYSVHMGHTVNEIVTGKPVFLGGSAGRRESTGRGVAFLVERALDTLKIKPGGCTAIVQGFGNVGARRRREPLLQGRHQDRRPVGRLRGVLRSEGHRPASRRASTCATIRDLSGFTGAPRHRPGGNARPALRHPDPRRRGPRHQRRERRQAASAASWPKPPTARPRRRPT